MTKSDTRLVSVSDIPLALVLLTRLPLPNLPEPAFARLAAAVWAFPLVGLVVALPVCGLGWAGMALGLPATAVAGLMLALQVVLTGAMHEDGLADVTDGFWGGFERERRLEIMKDSQIGTYGVLALILSLGLRWGVHTTLISAGGFAAIFAAAMWSRALMPVVMAALPHARSDGLSCSVGQPGWLAVKLGVAIAFLAGLALCGIPFWLAGLVSAMGVAILGRLAKAKIGGQTGDVLGASQQVAELLFLLALIAQI